MEYVEIEFGEKVFKGFCPLCVSEKRILKLRHLDEYYCCDCGNVFSKSEKIDKMDNMIKKMIG